MTTGSTLQDYWLPESFPGLPSLYVALVHLAMHNESIVRSLLEQCVAKLVHGVLILYLVLASSALER